MSPECSKKGSMVRKDWVINEMVSAHQEKCPEIKSDNDNGNGSNDTSSNQNRSSQRQEQQVQQNSGSQGFQTGVCLHQQSRSATDDMEQPIDCKNKLLINSRAAFSSRCDAMIAHDMTKAKAVMRMTTNASGSVSDFQTSMVKCLDQNMRCG